jgi:hypothetical protein
VRRSPEEWHGRALDGPGVYQLLSEKYPAYPVARLFGDAAKRLPVWAELAPAEQWQDVEAPLGYLDLKWPRVAATTRRTHAEALTELLHAHIAEFGVQVEILLSERRSSTGRGRGGS